MLLLVDAGAKHCRRDDNSNVFSKAAVATFDHVRHVGRFSAEVGKGSINPRGRTLVLRSLIPMVLDQYSSRCQRDVLEYFDRR